MVLAAITRGQQHPAVTAQQDLILRAINSALVAILRCAILALLPKIGFRRAKKLLRQAWKVEPLGDRYLLDCYQAALNEQRYYDEHMGDQDLEHPML